MGFLVVGNTDGWMMDGLSMKREDLVVCVLAPNWQFSTYIYTESR